MIDNGHKCDDDDFIRITINQEMCNVCLHRREAKPRKLEPFEKKCSADHEQLYWSWAHQNPEPRTTRYELICPPCPKCKEEFYYE